MSETDVKATTNKNNVVTIAKNDILYNRTTDEFIIADTSSFVDFKEEVDRFDKFKPYVKKLFPDGTKKVNDKESGAEIVAIYTIMTRYINAKSVQNEDDILNNLDKLITEEKDRILKEQEKTGANTANAMQLKDGDIAEILWFRQKRFVRIRSDKIKNHWRKFNRTLVEKQVKREFEKEKEKNAARKGPLKEVEVKLFEKKLFSKEGALFKCVEDINKKCSFNFFEDVDSVDAGIGTQFLRYSAESKFEGKIDWKNNMELSLAGKVEGSFALAQAQGHFDINIPDENGLDILEVIRDFHKDFVKTDANPIYLLLQIKTQGSAFLGACASIGINAGVQLKNPISPEGEPMKAEAGVELFAGGKADGNITLSAQMKIISDAKDPKWEELSSITYGGYASFGIGVDAKIVIKYSKGKIRFISKIGATLKVGAGTYIKFNLAPFHICNLVWTIGTSLEWDNMSDVLEGKVYDLYQSVMYECLCTGKQMAMVYDAIKLEAESLLDSTLEVAEESLDLAKNIDDMFDKWLPGYSGFKKFNPNFWMLKSTRDFLKRRNEKKSIQESTIELIDTIDKNKRWGYATWQVKSNLINDICTGGAGFGGLSQEDKEDATIKVLKSKRSPAEFQKILDNLKYSHNVDLDAELDFSQQTQLDTMKKENNYKEKD